MHSLSITGRCFSSVFVDRKAISICFGIIFIRLACIRNNMASGEEIVHSYRDHRPKMAPHLEKKQSGVKRGREPDSDSEVASEAPKMLDELGYEFNADGVLKEKHTGQPFKFEVKEGDHAYNQKRYEQLGEAVTEYVYELLEKEMKLNKIMVPIVKKGDEPQSFIFMSDNALTTTDKLMILIHGSGVVRAGQWSRRLIINDSLDKGTQFPYITRALKEGYEVIVLNTNLNYVDENGAQRIIRENSSPEEHANYVWEHFVNESLAKYITIVAHSYGGIVTLNVVSRFLDLKDRIFAIALTDSVHSLNHQQIGHNTAMWIKKISRNWVCSPLLVDTALPGYTTEIEKRSAGHLKHEMTSWSSMTAIFEFLKIMYNNAVQLNSKKEIKNDIHPHSDL